jgi:hypothetical protein
MYARDEQYLLDVLEDGFGDPFPCRRLAEKIVHIGPFTGTVRLRVSLDDVTFPEIHEEVSDGSNADGVLVPLPYACRAVRVESDGVVGDPPAVTLSGFLIG